MGARGHCAVHDSVFRSFFSVCMRVPPHLVVGDGEERLGSPPDTASSRGPLHWLGVLTHPQACLYHMSSTPP